MNVLNHIKRNLILWLSIVFICQVGAQPKPSSYKVDLDYYMPVEWQYTLNPDITTPELYLGFPLGSQHVDWSQVTGYMHLLSEQSDRFSIKTYGHTYENRPLFCLTITSPENQQNLEQIRKNHLKVIHGENVAGPVVTCVGSSIHGNEPSGVQGAIVVAYFLAAAQGKDIEKMLKESVILLIPGYNPDGINRFASWVNSNRNLSNTADSQSREFHEAGPGSRYNHYWHDLNRDWLFLEHPEPRFGVEVFHEWLPNVMSDHHEMGANSSFFFSPGDPKRVSDQLPQDNQKMTGVIAKYIQKDFDRLGSKYFTGRGYDDFYIGKGAAYGDVQGSVCLLCEQASYHPQPVISTVFNHLCGLERKRTVPEIHAGFLSGPAAARHQRRHHVFCQPLKSHNMAFPEYAPPAPYQSLSDCRRVKQKRNETGTTFLHSVQGQQPGPGSQYHGCQQIQFQRQHLL